MLSHADGARKKRRATEVALAAEDERLLASSGALRRRGRPMSLNEALRKGANVDTTRYMYSSTCMWSSWMTTQEMVVDGKTHWTLPSYEHTTRSWLRSCKTPNIPV